VNTIANKVPHWKAILLRSIVYSELIVSGIKNETKDDHDKTLITD